MTEQEALAIMVAPGTKRPGSYRQGVIQIHITRACDKACFGCTQGSQLAGKAPMITPEQFEEAVASLDGYFGVVGVFGGNPALHKEFPLLCEILRKHVPFERRGLWCNNPLGHGAVMRQTFDPSVSNLNVHLDQAAYDEFRRDWPECRPVGLTKDSRHSPPYTAIKDLVADEGERWALISNCDINKYWSAMVGVFRNQVRAWFCEIAGAQAMLHQAEPDYPDTGVAANKDWWRQSMSAFATQVRKHCQDCGVPLRGHGELATAPDGLEQVTQTHADVFRPKRKGRRVELVTVRGQLGDVLGKMTDYIGNAGK